MITRMNTLIFGGKKCNCVDIMISILYGGKSMRLLYEEYGLVVVFWWKRDRRLQKLDGIMRKEDYLEILTKNLKAAGTKFFIFQQRS